MTEIRKESCHACPYRRSVPSGVHLEAVQIRSWGPWHACRPLSDGTAGDRTFCGFNIINAFRMWQKWSEKTDRCKQCERFSKKYLDTWEEQ